MPRPVPRIGRLLDLAGLLVFAAGAGVYLRAWLGLRHLRRVQPVAEGAGDMPALARFNELWELSRTGVWVMVMAGMVWALAVVVARILADDRAEGPAPPDISDGDGGAGANVPG